MDPYTWIYLIIAIIVSVALAPKPPKPRPASLEDFDIPTAEEGRPIPVVFGTVRVTGPNILWYGDLGTKAMKKSSLFGSTTIGYKYYMGLHFGLCHGPVDAVTKIECGDKLAWSGNVTTNTSITVHKPDLFGGKKREGGISGTFDVCMGGSAQTANNYLDRAIGYNFITGEVLGDLPAFRGILGLVWRGGGSGGLFSMFRLDEGGYIGTTPYPKPWAFTVKRITAGWHGGTVWYSAKASIGGSAMNGAHIVYQTLTDPEWGMGLPADKLDAASFTAAADTLYAENFGLSLLWNQQATVEDFLTEILNHIAGVLAFDRSTGKYRLTLLRGNYDAGALPAYGPETLSSIDSFQRQAWGETVNELTLSYTDPTSLKSTSVTAHDLANVRAQGVRVATTVSYPGIVSATIAQEVAMRELAARSTPLAKVSFRVNRDLWPTKNADVVKLTWPALGIENLIVRVLRVRQGSLGFGELEIDAIEDVFALSVASYTSQPAPDAGEEDPGLDDVQDTAGPTVISTTTTTPPALPADGDTYLVPAGATGAWAGHEGETATWDEEADAWVFTTVNDGTVITDGTTGGQVQVTGGVAGATSWTPAIPPLAVATPDPLTDHIVFFDASANGYRKALASLGGGGGGGGGVGAGGVTGCMVNFAGTLNLTTAAADYYPNYTLVRDDGGYFNAGTPDRVTVPRDGWYVVAGMANGAVGADTFSCRIWVNGVATDLFSRHSVDTGVNAYVNVSGLLYLEAGDYVRMAINSRNGGDTCNLAAMQIASLLGSYTSPLADTILATTPDGYWKCDEVSGSTLADASGNGNNLTLSGTYTLAQTPLVPSDPAARFISFGTGGVATAAADIMGLGSIYAGDYSFAAVVIPRNAGSACVLCSHANTSGDAASQNYSFRPGITPGASVSDFFENGAGTDNVPSVPVAASIGHAQIVFVVRDSVNKVWTVYRNGVRVGATTYANNPTDGSASHRFRLANDVDGNNWGAPIGHAAFWKRQLTSTEIVSISQAAGFFNVGGGGGSVVAGSGGGYPSVLGYAGI